MKLYSRTEETVTTDAGMNTSETRIWERSLPEGMPAGYNGEGRWFVPQKLRIQDTINHVQDIEQTGDEFPGHYFSRTVELFGIPKGRKIATSMTWREDTHISAEGRCTVWGANPPSAAPAWVQALVEALTLRTTDV
jgi:hypothetical protein